MEDTTKINLAEFSEFTNFVLNKVMDEVTSEEEANRIIDILDDESLSESEKVGLIQSLHKQALEEIDEYDFDDDDF